MTRNFNFALTLSAGALAGLMALASASAPALARGNGGGGGGAAGGGAGPGGGESGDVMKVLVEPNIARQTTPNARITRPHPENCGDSQFGFDASIRQCRYTLKRNNRML